MQRFIPRDANQPKAPSVIAVLSTALVAFAVHNALKKHRHRTEHRFFMETPTDLEKSDTVTTLHM